MASQTGGKMKWFLPSVREEMPSEKRVRKNRKLAFHHYALKSESDDYVKKYNQIQANQMCSFRLIVWTPIPSLLIQVPNLMI